MMDTQLQPEPISPESRDEQARNVLRANDRGGYCVPTARLYPFQWNWDSCFCALGWATFNEPRAWEELDSLFSGQWPDGMVPHIIFHEPCGSYMPGHKMWGAGHGIPTSGITQPPVAAFCIRRLFERAEDKKLAEEKTRALFPKLLAYHRWFHKHRDPRNTGLVKIIHPWESGRDNSADWDAALARVDAENVSAYERVDTDHVDAAQRPGREEYDRYIALVDLFRKNDYDMDRMNPDLPFKVADVGINAILHRADKDLLFLSRIFGSTAEIIEITGWVENGAKSFSKLWSGEQQAFCSLDLIGGEHVSAVTSAAFLPFFAGLAGACHAKAMLLRLDEWAEKASYLVPSLSPMDARFDPRKYWRGPVWAVVNFMIATGLAEQGYGAYAEKVRQSTYGLILKNGFSEYFNPVDGAGLGGGDFSWTAAMWLAWLRAGDASPA